MPEDTKTYAMAEAVRAAYRAGEEDEAMEPRVLVDLSGKPVGRIGDSDYCIFYDIRGEREIELTEAFTDPEFDPFETAPITTHWATMIEYDPDLDVRVAFPPLGTTEDTLAETIAKTGRRQAKVVESEKAIHVSFFLNGKNADPFEGEDRFIVESQKDVANHDERPEMSAAEVADKAIEVVRGGAHDFVFVNFANVDVIGHIENREAILKAVNTVDTQVGRLVEAAREAGVATLITADHGTVEKWYYPEGSVDTGHTSSPVPLVVVDDELAERGGDAVRAGGSLIDVAPTVLDLMGIEGPEAMTGESLVAGPTPRRERVLVILMDGWGVGDGGEGDLIAAADTPNVDRLTETYPSTTLVASGPEVGMPEGTVGNSECGHLHIGAGRTIDSDRIRIEKAIESGSIRRNPAFREVMEGARDDGAALHLVGIISFYSSHGSVNHLLELMRMAAEIGVPEMYVHGMLGRRGERPESGAIYTELVEKETEKLDLGRFATIIGRFWSLDREENWDRIEKTYRAFVDGVGEPVPINE